MTTTTNTKAKPKSCGCFQCKRGAASSVGNAQRKHEERAARHQANAQTRLGHFDNLLPAYFGSYTD